MKTVYFVRHGKAEKPDKKESDKKRKLSPRGKREVRETAIALARERKDGFDIVLSSPAVRAMQTALIVTDCLSMRDTGIDAEEALYSTHSDIEIKNLLLALDDAKSSALVIGHNPGLSDAARLFLPETKLVLPTAGVVGVTFDVDSWKDLVNCKPTLKFSRLIIKKKKIRFMSRVQRMDLREKAISFIITVIKELGISEKVLSEESLRKASKSVVKAILTLVAGPGTRAQKSGRSVKQQNADFSHS